MDRRRRAQRSICRFLIQAGFSIPRSATGTCSPNPSSNTRTTTPRWVNRARGRGAHRGRPFFPSRTFSPGAFVRIDRWFKGGRPPPPRAATGSPTYTRVRVPFRRGGCLPRWKVRITQASPRTVPTQLVDQIRRTVASPRAKIANGCTHQRPAPGGSAQIHLQGEGIEQRAGALQPRCP